MKDEHYFTRTKYREYIPLNLGSFIEFKESNLIFEILNNIPTIVYNFEYKSYEDLSLLSLLYNPDFIRIGIDNVFNNIEVIFSTQEKIEDRFKDYTRIKDKSKLIHYIFNTKKRKFIIYDKKRKNESDKHYAIRMYDKSEECKNTLRILRKYVKIQTSKKVVSIINVLLDK